MAHFYTQFAVTPADQADLAWHAAGLLVAHHGAAPEAIAGLRWPQVAFVEGQLELLDPQTARSRTVTMAPCVSETLLRLRNQQLRLAEDQARVRAALTNPDGAYVLLDQRGQPSKPDEIVRRLNWLRHARIAAVMHQLNAETPGAGAVPHPADCPVCACSGVDNVNLQRLANLLAQRHARRAIASG